MSDQDRISPHNINIISSRQVMRIGKILIRDYYLIHYQIPQTNFRSTIWQTVRRIIVNEILGVTGKGERVKG